MADKKCIHYGDCQFDNMSCEEDEPWFKCPDRATEKRTLSVPPNELVSRIEANKFECVAGRLENCKEWRDLKTFLGVK